MTDATRRPNQTDEGSTLYGTVPTPGTEDSPIVPVAIDSADLLQGAREIAIRHDGAIYRLRRTSKGKLILTK